MLKTKTIPFFIILIFFFQCKKNDSADNVLEAPENWRSEVIKFPLKFAKILDYSGAEHVRFAPGWGKEDAKDYFSYAFLWEIDQNPKLSSEKLEHEMEIYFDGLMNMVAKMNLKLLKKIPKSKAFFEKVNDSVYAGKILTYDAFTTKKEINLNTIVEYKFCKLENKHLVLFTLSPQAPEHPIWKKMKKLTIDLECE